MPVIVTSVSDDGFKGIRRFGSAALDLAWVAAGRFDCFWERGLKHWDVAAGFVLMNFIVDMFYAVLDPRIRHGHA